MKLKRLDVPRSLAMALVIVSALAGPARAGDPGLRHEGTSYRVHLGVTPAWRLEQMPELVDRDKHLHGGLARELNTMHVTAAIFDRRGNRVSGVTVIAELSHRRWTHPARLVRPLERMTVGGVITYGNFFRMAERGEYQIVLHIYSTAGDQPEVARFVYRRPD